MWEITILSTMQSSVAMFSGNTQYPSTHTLWKKELHGDHGSSKGGKFVRKATAGLLAQGKTRTWCFREAVH